MSKGILFLSIMDFTDKGIQVVKLTPEFFAKNGWNVHYAVTRDNSKNGSYHYQEVISPEGVVAHRTDMPSCWLGERLNSRISNILYAKIRGYAAIVKLAWIGHKVLKSNHIDVIYGGGPHGVLAANLLKYFCAGKNKIIVSRFYGTFLVDKFLKKHWAWFSLNWDECLAFKLSTDLIIVTNDGTMGNVAVKMLSPRNISKLRFWVNGVNLVNNPDPNPDPDVIEAVTICRLVNWKRVDRAITCVGIIVNTFKVKDFKYHIVGDGAELSSLKKLAYELGVEKNVVFHGALKHEEAIKLLLSCNLYISTYDLSNVGNPLLEAIRANKIIFTLNNGDTSAWIKHRENGFIYDINDSTIDDMAHDIVDLLSNPALMDQIKRNIRITEQEKLWTWNERMQAEFSEIEKLVP